jgi:catechol 2,3-dioxygenase-like lactoylglutathione lyase family enzyme
MQNTWIKYVGMTVADMDRSIDFYTNVLHCQKVSDHETVSNSENELVNEPIRVVQLQLGHETIQLTEYLKKQGRTIPDDSRSNDVWFQQISIVVKDMEEAYQHIKKHEVAQVSANPQTIPHWNLAFGDIQAFSLKDPDGHNLELICFPDGKGEPRWHCATESLFMGIDRTAIVVENSDQSRAFYCDLLGLTLEKDTKNVGLEQERLSNLPRVQVRVSNLEATDGMDISLIEYLTPRPERFIPSDTQENDLWFWHTTIAVSNLNALIQKLKEDQSLLHCSKWVITESESEVACLIKDPDGHRVRLVER